MPHNVGNVAVGQHSSATGKRSTLATNDSSVAKMLINGRLIARNDPSEPPGHVPLEFIGRDRVSAAPPRMFQHVGIKRPTIDELLRRFEHRMQRWVGVSCAQFVVEEHYAVFDIVQRGVKRC
jgi:hypothetical protein